MKNNQLIGVGLRQAHYDAFVTDPPPIGWVEVHSENFFQTSSKALDMLTEISKDYPLSLHGVGLSLGSADGILDSHLQRIKNLTDKLNPFLVSEHLSWGYVDNVYIPDLLPLPYNRESFGILRDNISKAQDYLGRQILIENPSTYLEFTASNIKESEFLSELTIETGCGLLLDVNNVFVSCHNHNWDAKKYLDSIDGSLVQEIHLAGHSTQTLKSGKKIIIDTHDNFVCTEVWDLYSYAIKRYGKKHTLLEWDQNIPEFDILINESKKALQYIGTSIYENA